MFEIIFVAWGVGMAGYIVLSKIGKYNHQNYYDVSGKIQRFKGIRDRINSKGLR